MLHHLFRRYILCLNVKQTRCMHPGKGYNYYDYINIIYCNLKFKYFSFLIVNIIHIAHKKKINKSKNR